MLDGNVRGEQPGAPRNCIRRNRLCLGILFRSLEKKGDNAKKEEEEEILNTLESLRSHNPKLYNHIAMELYSSWCSDSL